MGARHKLNSAYINGALAVAAVIGLLAQSGTIFVVVALIGLATCLHSGDIRLNRDRDRRNPKKP